MDQQNKSSEWHITYHFVWGPMRSKPCLIGEVARRLQALIEEKAREEDFQPVTLLILPDRVYLAAEAPPSVAPHTIVCQVKAYTSRVLRDEFPELTRIPSLWTRAYLVMAGDEVEAGEVLARFAAAQPERRPRGRPPKTTQASPHGDAAEGAGDCSGPPSGPVTHSS
ncbi:MAG: IS200/IS605 family transposase [Ktedonobacterales bacterium]